MKKGIKILIYLAAAALAIFILIQFVPYGKDHANPPVVQEPKWDKPATRDLFVKDCFNCHSNETYYPWYGYIAPSSWLLAYDVSHARDAMNFSDWNSNYGIELATLIKRNVDSGQMPPWYFLLLHPEARPDAAEKQALYDGILATLKNK